MGERAFLLYDDQCGFCRASVRALLAMGGRRSLEPVAIQSERGHELTPGLSDEQRLSSFHLVEGGSVLSGPDALAETFRRVPPLSLVGAVLERSDLAKRAAGAAYHWVSKHRGMLSRFVPERFRRPL